MRISDWSSDVCSSDLQAEHVTGVAQLRGALARARAADRSSVVVIDTDPRRTTEAGGWWWDVAVPEVSDRPEVNIARQAYEAAVPPKRNMPCASAPAPVPSHGHTPTCQTETTAERTA